MSYLALYRKYRPTDFDSLEGQKEIVKVLKNSIINNKVSHAYLFSGPRGTGKTTTAKIISKLVNCENLVNGNLCGHCKSCTSVDNNDIIEIDAASNNGVDEIREIRENANLVPSNCKYKIYIIDEVHMLTTQAFNALLKTLEEPPKHIIFILATTEYHKIPLTVVSRCQRFQFNKLTNDDIVNRLKFIAKEENITISEDALFEIARIADGAMRDAINLLDQLNSYKNNNICLNDVYEICEIVSTKEIVEFLINIKNGNSKFIINFVDDINNKGYNLNKFIEEVIYFLKDCIIYNFNNSCVNVNEELINDIYDKYNFNEINDLIIDFNSILNSLKLTSYPSIILVVELLRLINKLFVNKSNVKLLNVNNLINNDDVLNEKKIIEETKEIENIKIKKTESIKDKDIELIDDNFKCRRINNTFATADKTLLINVKKQWKKITDYILDDKYGSIVGILKDCNPVVVGNKDIILMSSLVNVVDRINSDYKLVEEFLAKVLENRYNVICLTNDEWNNEKNKYIINIKNNFVYTYIDEPVDKVEEKDAVSELIDIVGADLIEYI